MSGTQRRPLTEPEWQLLADSPEPQLLALWADTREVYALLEAEPDTPLLVSTPVVEGQYPALSPARPLAARFERMIRDLWGHEAAAGTDQRPWLDHGHWAQSAPMALRPGPPPGAGEPADFLPAGDESLDQLPVGPVRGLIEPSAHLHLSVRGETIARLEARLGYVHRGVLTLMRGKSPRTAARFAARLAGDATVAHAIAFARAAETALQVEIPPRAVALRSVMGELERITCCLARQAACAEAAGAPRACAQAARHEETLRRAAHAGFGHRLMMDCVVPGGVTIDMAAGGAAAIGGALAELSAELPSLERSRDRMRRLCVGATPHLYPGPIAEGIRIARAALEELPAGPVSAGLPTASGEALGFADGPAGRIWHWLRLDHGQIASVFMCDPAWAQWTLLEGGMAGGQADDLSLAMASRGLRSAGVDL